jgi:uncharacterized coiled-coil protein SlyX
VSSLTAARRSTSRRLASAELPAAFQLATIAACSNALSRNTVSAKDSRRRLQSKALRLASVEAV